MQLIYTWGKFNLFISKMKGKNQRAHDGRPANSSPRKGSAFWNYWRTLSVMLNRKLGSWSCNFSASLTVSINATSHTLTLSNHILELWMMKIGRILQATEFVAFLATTQLPISSWQHRLKPGLHCCASSMHKIKCRECFKAWKTRKKLCWGKSKTDSLLKKIKEC